MAVSERRLPKIRTNRALAGAAELRCGACGEPGVFRATASSCPSCRANRWELAPWRPFSRAAH